MSLRQWLCQWLSVAQWSLNAGMRTKQLIPLYVILVLSRGGRFIEKLTWFYWKNIILQIKKDQEHSFLWFTEASAVPVLNLSVWNVLFSCPVLMLQSYFRIIPCHQWVTFSFIVCRTLCAKLFINSLWFRAKLENIVFILPGLSALKYKVWMI